MLFSCPLIFPSTRAGQNRAGQGRGGQGRAEAGQEAGQGKTEQRRQGKGGPGGPGNFEGPGPPKRPWVWGLGYHQEVYSTVVQMLHPMFDSGWERPQGRVGI